MPIKGLEKRGGVPASPLAMPGQVESGKKGPIQQKGFFPASITDLYWEQSVGKKRSFYNAVGIKCKRTFAGRKLVAYL